MLILNIIILLVSLFFIIKFSDMFVDAATSIAEGFRIPKMVIALTIAAFSTCAPELAISFNSISSGNAEMTLANVIGSSIVNILLIIGISAIVKPIKLKERTIKRELPLLVLITTAFFLARFQRSHREQNTSSDCCEDSDDNQLQSGVFLLEYFQSTKKYYDENQCVSHCRKRSPNPVYGGDHPSPYQTHSASSR